MTYVPLTYVQDVHALLSELAVGRFAAVGTSLGGIVTMLLAGAERGRLAGALLNDVGPEIDPKGAQRIRGYVGRASSWPTWMHAARGLAEANADVYPDWRIEDWLRMAKRLYRLNSAGRIVLDYDLRIAEPFRVSGTDAGPDLWRALEGLSDTPTLIVRGGRSDVLAEETAKRMAAALPRAELAVAPNVGHTPTLAEPELEGPIARWLEQVKEPAPA